MSLLCWDPPVISLLRVKPESLCRLRNLPSPFQLLLSDVFSYHSVPCSLYSSLLTVPGTDQTPFCLRCFVLNSFLCLEHSSCGFPHDSPSHFIHTCAQTFPYHWGLPRPSSAFFSLLTLPPPPTLSIPLFRFIFLLSFYIIWYLNFLFVYCLSLCLQCKLH